MMKSAQMSSYSEEDEAGISPQLLANKSWGELEAMASKLEMQEEMQVKSL